MRDKGWTGAIDLRAGDILVLQDGGYVIIEKIQHEILEKPVTVYNFEVEDFHTYYVGTNSVLVHNMCAQRYTEEQQIVLEFTKEFKDGIGFEDAVALVEMAKHVGLNHHVPQMHPNQSGYWSDELHIKIANKHIRVFEE